MVTILRIKCLYESDITSAAVDEAEAHVAAYGDDGAFQYYRGVAHYHKGSFTPDSGASLERAIACFTEAAARGFGGGQIGLGMVALAEKRFDEAVAILSKRGAVTGELEHVRLRILFFSWMLRGDPAMAEECLTQADQLLATMPSLLMRYWGDVCRVYHLRVSGQFDTARVIANSLMSQVTQMQAPRLYDQIAEEVGHLARREMQVKLGTPATPLPPDELRDLGKKRMLNSLFHALVRAGEHGASKHELVRDLWSESYEPRLHDERLHKSINRLRHLLGKSNAEMPPILTQRGSRYILSVYRDASGS
jgi:hypothetical protein